MPGPAIQTGQIAAVRDGNPEIIDLSMMHIFQKALACSRLIGGGEAPGLEAWATGAAGPLTIPPPQSYCYPLGMPVSRQGGNFVLTGWGGFNNMQGESRRVPLRGLIGKPV